MKRRFLAELLICVLLISLLTSCSTRSKPLTECGEEVISLMAEMIESEEFRSLYTLPDDYDDGIEELCEGNYSKSSAVYELLIPEDELLDTAVGVDEDELSEDLYKYICMMSYNSFATRINQASGSESITLSAVFSAQKSFVNKHTDASKIYLYVFKKGNPVVVTFTEDGEGIIKAVGHFIINDTFETDDEDSIKESCEALGIKDVTVKKQ